MYTIRGNNMKTIDIYNTTNNKSNIKYTTYFLDVRTNQTYKVIAGGNSCLATCKKQLEMLGVGYWDIKEISPEVKKHKKYFN